MSGTNSSIIGKLIVTALVIAWAVASMVPFGDTPFEDYIKTRATANQQEFVQVLKDAQARVDPVNYRSDKSDYKKGRCSYLRITMAQGVFK